MKLWEILTSSSPDKIGFPRLAEYSPHKFRKTKIQNTGSSVNREENIIEGKGTYRQRNATQFDDFLTEEIRTPLCLGLQKYDCTTLDDFYAKIGYGGIILTKAVNRINDEYNKAV